MPQPKVSGKEALLNMVVSILVVTSLFPLSLRVMTVSEQLEPTARAWHVVAAFGIRPARTGAW